MEVTPQFISQIKQYSVSNKNSLNTLFNKLRRVKSKELDPLFHQFHSEVFSELDCLDCANCCKSISPVLYEADISRLAESLKLRVSAFKNNYVKTDMDGDYVFKQTPCPFLNSDNSCRIYANRPKACREYPHTDRRRMYQILDITAKNISVCPAVFLIIEKIKSKI